MAHRTPDSKKKLLTLLKPRLDLAQISQVTRNQAQSLRPQSRPLLALSGHALVHCTCLLLTQSGHQGPHDSDDVG